MEGVAAKGWDTTALRRGLRRLPRSLPQGHRWFLLKVHLNAPLTSARRAASGNFPIQRCFACGLVDRDRWSHLTRCGVVMSTCDQLFAGGRIPAMADAQPALMMQTEHDGGSTAAIIAVSAAIWRVRAACRVAPEDVTQAALYALVERCLGCPWLVRSVATTGRKERDATEAG